MTSGPGKLEASFSCSTHPLAVWPPDGGGCPKIHLGAFSPEVPAALTGPARFTRRSILTALGAGAVAALLRPSAILARPTASIVDPLRDSFSTLALQTARANILDRKLFPSRAYSQGTWLRDAYWTLPVLEDARLKQYTWERFANRQDPTTGQVPPALLHSEDVYYWADDESTALFLLLALELKRANVPVWPWPLEPAARYLVARVDADGYVRSGPGPFAWWLDTLALGQRDAVSYNQGVVAVALRAAAEMGLSLPPGLVGRAEAAYAALYRPDLGAMALSAGTTLLDVSCLVGEHLSIRYFQRSLLTREVVQATLGAFRQVRFPDGAFLGFPVAAQRDGSYMPEDWFYPAPDNWPGYYHNGGSWLLYDAIALEVGRTHGVPAAAGLLRERVAAETRRDATLHEYIATSDARGDLGTTPFSWRTGYSWNSYVATLAWSQAESPASRVRRR